MLGLLRLAIPALSCPKNIPDEKCEGHGDRSKCIWFSQDQGKCYYVDDSAEAEAEMEHPAYG